MNYETRPAPARLTCNDLNGVGASLRTIFTVADDGKFDAILRHLDMAYRRCGQGSAAGNSLR